MDRIFLSAQDKRKGHPTGCLFLLVERHLAAPNAARCDRASLRRKLVSLPGLCPGNASFPHTRPLPFVILPYGLRSKLTDYPMSEWSAVHSSFSAKGHARLACSVASVLTTDGSLSLQTLFGWSFPYKLTAPATRKGERSQFAIW